MNLRRIGRLILLREPVGRPALRAYRVVLRPVGLVMKTVALVVGAIGITTSPARALRWELAAVDDYGSLQLEPGWHLIRRVGRARLELFWLAEPAARPGIRFGRWLGRTQITVGRTQVTFMPVFDIDPTPEQAARWEADFTARTGIRVGDVVTVNDTLDRPGGAS